MLGRTKSKNLRETPPPLSALGLTSGSSVDDTQIGETHDNATLGLKRAPPRSSGPRPLFCSPLETEGPLQTEGPVMGPRTRLRGNEYELPGSRRFHRALCIAPGPPLFSQAGLGTWSSAN